MNQQRANKIKQMMQQKKERRCKYHSSLKGQKKKASRVAQLVKNLPAMQETPVQFLGGEGPLEKG